MKPTQLRAVGNRITVLRVVAFAVDRPKLTLAITAALTILLAAGHSGCTARWRWERAEHRATFDGVR